MMTPEQQSWGTEDRNKKSTKYMADAISAVLVNLQTFKK